jgi:hypothetical protein
MLINKVRVITEMDTLQQNITTKPLTPTRNEV